MFDTPPKGSQNDKKLSAKTIEKMIRRTTRKDIPIVVGGIIPENDFKKLKKLGVSKVYTPKDFELNKIMFDLIDIADP